MSLLFCLPPQFHLTASSLLEKTDFQTWIPIISNHNNKNLLTNRFFLYHIPTEKFHFFEKFWWQTFQSLLEICLDVPDAHLFISKSFNNLRSYLMACWLFVFIKSFPNSVLNYNFCQIEKPRCIKIKMYASVFIWAIKENAREQLRQTTTSWISLKKH